MFIVQSYRAFSDFALVISKYTRTSIYTEWNFLFRWSLELLMCGYEYYLNYLYNRFTGLWVIHERTFRYGEIVGFCSGIVVGGHAGIKKGVVGERGAALFVRWFGGRKWPYFLAPAPPGNPLDSNSYLNDLSIKERRKIFVYRPSPPQKKKKKHCVLGGGMVWGPAPPSPKNCCCLGRGFEVMSFKSFSVNP